MDVDLQPSSAVDTYFVYDLNNDFFSFLYTHPSSTSIFYYGGYSFAQ